mmetsp:Transcript_43671/g.103068  ORF Transcript_43671/g.103068 Transcript_43671/m.103068 type:complete len:181 (-) Transcript_43671:178-720(-)
MTQGRALSIYPRGTQKMRSSQFAKVHKETRSTACYNMPPKVHMSCRDDGSQESSQAASDCECSTTPSQGADAVVLLPLRNAAKIEDSQDSHDDNHGSDEFWAERLKESPKAYWHEEAKRYVFCSTFLPEHGIVGSGWRADGSYISRNGVIHDTTKDPPEPCFNCGEMHWRKDCPFRSSCL